MIENSNEIVVKIAHELGFDLVGFAKYENLAKEVKFLKNWVFERKNGEMEYLERNDEKRENIREILPTAKSVISLGMNYYQKSDFSNSKNVGKISKYAIGKDYHLIIWEKLKLFEAKLKEIFPTIEMKSYVDTGPIMDKIWAVKSGLGWMGKHTNIINRKIGSWFFIANIISNLDFNYGFQSQDFCGSCSACLDACPTNALENYKIDANKCISYLTIENKKEIPLEFVGKFENWLFGCDICQDVCPWNKKFAKKTKIKEFQPRIPNEIELSIFENLTNKTFEEKFSETPVLRSRLKGMKRNAKFLTNN